MNHQVSQFLKNPIIGGLLSALLFSLLSKIIGDFAVPFALIPFLTAALFTLTIKDRIILSLAPISLVIAFLGPVSAFSFATMIIAPGLLLTTLYQQTQRNGDGTEQPFPLARLVGSLSIYAFFLVLLTLVIWMGADIQGKAYQMIMAQFDLLHVPEKPSETQIQLDRVKSFLTQIWPLMPGIYTSVFMLFFTLGVSLTQKSFSRRKLTLPREKLCLSNLYLSWFFWKVVAGLGVLTALAFFFGSFTLFTILTNITLPLITLFFLQGLTIVITYAKNQKNPKMFLVISYGIMVLIGWIIIIVILAGLLEPWLDLRSRMNQKIEKE